MAGKGNRNRFLDMEIRLVLVGKTGVGKSETGNTICGDVKGAQIFEAGPSGKSVTKKCKQHCFTRFGYDLQLVDVPGFADTGRLDEDIKQEVTKCVGMSSPGIHAILFIVRIGRFNEEDKNTLEKFLQCFGNEAKRFVIVLFTGKDDLEAGADNIDNYIRSCPAELKQFLDDTSHRFIAVNNRGTNEEKEKFTIDLIDKVKCMVDENGGQCYTNEMYKRWEVDLQKAEKKEILEGKRQEAFEKRLEQEAADFEEHFQRQRLEMHEKKKLFEKKRNARDEKYEEQVKVLLKALLLTQKEEKEKQPVAEQKEARRCMRIVLRGMEDQMEEFERRKEELHIEEARKQIREKVEEGNITFILPTVQAVLNIASSIW